MNERDKVVSNDIMSEMYNLMKSIKLKEENSAIDTESVASVLKIFVAEKERSIEDLLSMVENWIIEEDN